MKTLKMILKGVLMYVTLFSCIVFICGGAPILIEEHKWTQVIGWFILNLILVAIWYNTISYKEANRLSPNDWIDDMFRN